MLLPESMARVKEGTGKNRKRKAHRTHEEGNHDFGNKRANTDRGEVFVLI